MEAPTTHCRNCGTAIDGQYCKSCGQREGRGDLHFAEAATDIMGDVVTWDSRVWRTLFSLLFRPGFLSAEFNAGRRMRYMPPFRLYIVVSFLMFLVISLTAGDAVISGEWDDDSSDSVVTLGVELDSPSDDASTDARPTETEDARAVVQDALQRELAQKKASGDEEAVRVIEEIEASIDPNTQDDGFTINLLEGGPPWMQELEKRIEANARLVKEDPRDYVDDLLAHLPQVMFVMLPFFALLLKLVYFFSPFHYLQHLVFALHYHTFVYLLALIATAVEKISWNVDGLFSLLLIIYLPLALRRCYSSSWGGAIGKSSLLLLSYGVALIVGMITAAVMVLAAM